jgi:hypothetical protein
MPRANWYSSCGGGRCSGPAAPDGTWYIFLQPVTFEFPSVLQVRPVPSEEDTGRRPHYPAFDPGGASFNLACTPLRTTASCHMARTDDDDRLRLSQYRWLPPRRSRQSKRSMQFAMLRDNTTVLPN